MIWISGRLRLQTLDRFQFVMDRGHHCRFPSNDSRQQLAYRRSSSTECNGLCRSVVPPFLTTAVACLPRANHPNTACVPFISIISTRDAAFPMPDSSSCGRVLSTNSILRAGRTLLPVLVLSLSPRPRFQNERRVSVNTGRVCTKLGW